MSQQEPSSEPSPQAAAGPERSRLRRILSGLGAWLTVILFFLGIGEAVVRLVYYNGYNFTLEMWKYARHLKVISPDPLIGHTHRPYGRAHLMGVDVFLNSRGLRDREFEYAKPEGVRRVVMLGDSETFGWGVPQGKTTPKVLERLLNRDAPGGTRYEVINTGVGNYNTQMEIRYFLTESYKYQPDMVTLNYVFNDAEETPRYQGNFLNEHSQLWVWLGGKIDILLRKMGKRGDWNAYYSGLYSADAKGWINTQRWLRSLADYCREHGILLVFVNHPELRVLKPYPFLWLNDKLRRLAGELGMGFVELYEAVKDEAPASLWVTAPDPHPNAKACGLFGRFIYESIKDQLYRLDKPLKSQFPD